MGNVGIVKSPFDMLPVSVTIAQREAQTFSWKTAMSLPFTT